MKKYPGKLLLFGEYLLLTGAPAIAAPAPAFGGQWAWKSDGTPIVPEDDLMPFARSEAVKTALGADAERFSTDLAKGLYFQSNIPRGYGLGSSGALCAAVYDRYAHAKEHDPPLLKGIFAGMESFFHGNSSGLDPLTSYLNQPLFLVEKDVLPCRRPTWPPDEEPVVFLLDSGLARRTGPLVEWFMQRRTEADFLKKIREKWRPAHEALVQGWLSADAPVFWETLRRLSVFQLENLPPMIPAGLRAVWKKSLDNQDVVLKLCGAGGGGFTLGFAKNEAAARSFSGQVGQSIFFPFTPQILADALAL